MGYSAVQMCHTEGVRPGIDPNAPKWVALPFSSVLAALLRGLSVFDIKTVLANAEHCTVAGRLLWVPQQPCRLV